MEYDLADQETGQRYTLLWAKRVENGMIRAIARKLGSDKMVDFDPELPAFRLYENKVPQMAKEKVAGEFARFMGKPAMEAALAERAEQEKRAEATKRVVDLSSKDEKDREVYYVPRELQAEFDKDRRANRIMTKWDRDRQLHVGMKGPEGRMARWMSDEMKARLEEERAILSIRGEQKDARRQLFGAGIARARSVQDGMSLAAEFPKGLRLPSEGKSELGDMQRTRMIELVGQVVYEADLKEVINATRLATDLAEIALVRKAAPALNVGIDEATRGYDAIVHDFKAGKKGLPIGDEVLAVEELKAGTNLLWTRMRELGYGATRGVEKGGVSDGTAQALKDMRAADQSKKDLGVGLSESGRARHAAGEFVPAVEATARGPRRGRAARTPEPELETAGGLER